MSLVQDPRLCSFQKSVTSPLWYYNPDSSTADSMADDIQAAVEAKTGLPLDSFRSCCHLLPFACLPLVSPSCSCASHDVNCRETVHQPASCILSRSSVSLHATMVAETGICAPAATFGKPCLLQCRCMQPPLHKCTFSVPG